MLGDGGSFDFDINLISTFELVGVLEFDLLAGAEGKKRLCILKRTKWVAAYRNISFLLKGTSLVR
jgi:hypothetical protein